MNRNRFFRLVLVSLASAFFAGAATAQKLYTGSWIAESFGNDLVVGSAESAYFSVVAIPHGNLCEPAQPRCPFSSTPLDSTGNFDPLGQCAPLTKPRPAKGGTVTRFVPPLYRNPVLFTPGGAPDVNACTAAATALGAKATQYLAPGDPNRGVVQLGKPLTGSGNAATAGGADPVGFSFPAAPPTRAPGVGMFRTTIGSRNRHYPLYLYSYTYAALRNDAGIFGRGQGFFSTAAVATKATFKAKAAETTVATVTVTPGASQFGGVMRLLGNVTSKVCYFVTSGPFRGCFVATKSWLYQYVGQQGYKNQAGSVLTAPYTERTTFKYYGVLTDSTYTVLAQRFPWTTGTVTVNATLGPPHRTIEVRKGFDNRVSGIGTVQLVSPVLTQWRGSPFVHSETGGIAVLSLHFVPEPSTHLGLVAGLSVLGVPFRFRR